MNDKNNIVMNTCKLLITKWLGKKKRKKEKNGMQATCHTLPFVIICNGTTNKKKNLEGAQFVHCLPLFIIYNETKK